MIDGVIIKFVPKSDLPIVEVIREFITDFYAKRQIAICGIGDSLLFVLKDTTPDNWEQTIQNIEQFEKLPLPDAVQLIKEWGRTYPFIQIIEAHGNISIMYYQTVVLDFRHPQFFDHLEAALKHVAENDDLSQFSLRPGTASSSDHD